MTTGKALLKIARNALRSGDPFPASTVATAVYELDYPTIGAVFSEIHHRYEGLTFTLEADGHNFLEEALILVLMQTAETDLAEKQARKKARTR